MMGWLMAKTKLKMKTLGSGIPFGSPLSWLIDFADLGTDLGLLFHSLGSKVSEGHFQLWLVDGVVR